MVSTHKIGCSFVLMLFGGLLLSSCQRNMVLSGKEYLQYSISDSLAPDSAVIRYYQPYKDKMQAEMEKVIGETARELSKPANPETLMGNFFADALLHEGLKRDSTIQFTLSTKGGLRTTFPQGNVTVSKVFELMPFENELVVLTLTGESVQKVIDFIVKKEGEPISGMRMKIRNHAAYDVTIGGQPFDVNRSYQMLTYDYLADGGDELDFLRFATSRKEINQKVREALLENISELTRQGKKIDAQLDGRISMED